MRKILIILLFTQTAIGQSLSSSEIIDRTINKLLSIKSLSYSCNYEFKGYNLDMIRDTFRFESKIYLKRDFSDELFGGSFFYKQNESVVKLYENESTYIKDITKATYTKQYNDSKYGNNVQGSNYYGALFFYYLHPKTLRIHKDSKRFSDTVFKGIDCYRVSTYFQLPIEGAPQDFMTFLISKNDFMPVCFISNYFMSTYNQYSSLYMYEFEYNYNFDSLLRTQLDFSKHTELIYDDIMDNTAGVKSIGKQIKELSGTNFYKNTIDTIKLANKLTLLDFWYVGCSACKRVSDSLEILIEKYKSQTKFQVYGLDWIDNDDKGIKKLKKYNSNYVQKYPTLLISEKINQDFTVVIYPTLILIDESGKVIWRSIGLDSISSQELKDILEEKLIN